MRNITLLTTVEPGRATLLDFYLRRYLPWVDDCMIFFQKDDDDTDTSALEEVCGRYHVDHTDIVGDFDCAVTFTIMEEWARSNLSGGWLLPVDVDEFVEVGVNLRQLTAECEANGWLWVRGMMTDRHAVGGRITQLDPDTPLEMQFPLRSEITGEIARGAQTKVVLARWPLIGKIHLYAGDGSPLTARVHPCTLTLNHYKWHSDVVARLERRVELQTRQGKPWAAEHARMLAYLEAHGRVNMPDYLVSASGEIPGGPGILQLYPSVIRGLPDRAHVVVCDCGTGNGPAYLAELSMAFDKTIRIDCLVEPAEPGGGKSMLPGFCQAMELAGGADRVRAIQLSEGEAARAYRDHSLDFVSLPRPDPGRALAYSLDLWIPKLKPGAELAICASAWEGGEDEIRSYCAAHSLQLHVGGGSWVVAAA